MNGPEIAAAFMQQNDKRTWKARNVNRARNTGAGDVVHFESSGGMVSLMYYVESGRFAVKFNKFHGAWGDYIKAIARSLFVVLNTLKSAGLPFDAPPTLAGMVIEATTTDDNTTYVRWPGTGENLFGNRGTAYTQVHDEIDAAPLDAGELGEHLQAAGFQQVQPEGLPEGVSMFVGTRPVDNEDDEPGKLPPVL
jgi:hypothetical protein